jgi:heme/copper-type cytochrome/quinol oxidase subunit 3
MRPRPVIDVSALETTAIGHRAPLWWGVMGMIAIESTMFALLAATYFYLRGNASVWPPPRNQPPLALDTVLVALLLLSVFPMWKTLKAAKEGRLRGMRFWLSVATVLGLACLVVRGFEFATIGFRWDAHVYGSIVWSILGMHALHLLASNGENLLFLALLFKGPVEEKHLGDLYLNAFYWFFVVISWLPFYAIVFLDPGIFKAGPGGM